jgi:C4-dicarboxylate transporter DctM subunit
VIYPLFFRNKPDGKLIPLIRKSAVSTAVICCILGTATIAARMIGSSGVAKALSTYIISVSSSKIIFLLFVNILLLLVGMFLDNISAILIFTPLLLPIAQYYGVDPVHFGAIVLLNTCIGLITPPMCGNVFLACGMTNTKMNEVIKPMIPFYICCLPVLLLTTYVPEISMFFVNMMR